MRELGFESNVSRLHGHAQSKRGEEVQLFPDAKFKMTTGLREIYLFVLSNLWNFEAALWRQYPGAL